MAEMFDLIVLGGGPAGYLAAERAAHAGLKTAVFEKRALGGVCLNEGCIPSKALLNSAKMYDHALHGDKYGVLCTEVKLDQKKVVARRGKVVRTLVAGVGAKMKGAGVTVVKENAVIKGRVAGGFAVEAAGETYTCVRLLIATGSSAVVPPIPGVRENLGEFVVTNREVLELKEIPKEFVVIGGGVIGLEMVAYYATAGAKVTVVEMLDHIAGPTDREISGMLQKELEKKGVTFLLSHKCLAVEPGKVIAEAPDGQKVEIAADKVLLSIGRRANYQDIGLETIGVETNRAGILTDGQGRTNVENVYAAGDVNGHHMLAHTAYRESEVAVNTMLGKRDIMRYHANPSVIYTQPEIASVGMTEEEAKAAGVEYEVEKLSMRYAGRFVAENEGADGLCKVLVDARHRNIIGVHMIGAYCGEIIWGAAEMIESELRVTDAREIIFPHPTVSEIIREVLWEFKD
ncbi:MAG: dihydrolipoyl dehydrogenase [Christensenellales bacterium]|nr:dihydrolipoyl dehydrogenase [Christensenellales bacterium]